MKRIIVAFLLILNIGIAYGASDKTITSKKYVDNQLATKQDKIQAIDDKTVITHTGSAGEIGEKGIYDSTNNYAEQQTSLVTAGDANTGINNALENEFVCVEFDTDGTCLLWNLRAVAVSQLPSEYTPLEYISFDGASSSGAYINTGLRFYSDIPNNKIRFLAEAKMYASLSGWQVIVGGVGSASAYMGTNSANLFYYSAGFNDTSTTVANPYKKCSHYFDAALGRYTVYNMESGAQIVNKTFNATARTTNIPILIGAYCYPNGAVQSPRAKMDLYSIKIYNDNVLRFDGIPCKRKSDNVVGIYDIISNSFKTNVSGTNALVAGPVLDTYLPSGN
jgi:hypothetical protein